MVARFLRLTDRQLFWGRAAPAAAPAAALAAAPAPRKVPGNGPRYEAPAAPAPAPPKKKKQRRQGCDCAATGPHRRTCPLYRPPAPKPTPTDFWAREAARRTDEVQARVKEIGGVEDEDDDEEEASPRASAVPKPKPRRAPSMKTCPACSLKVHNRRTTCPGCGAAFPKKTDAHWSGGVWRPASDVAASTAPPAPPPTAPPAALPPAAPPGKRRADEWTPDEDATLQRLYAEHSQTPHNHNQHTPLNDRGSLWDVIAAAMGTRRTASAAETRWRQIKNRTAPAPAAAEPPAKKRKKSEKRVEKKKKKQRSRVWDLDKKKYVTS